MWGDTMKAKVNIQLLRTTTFDSGALGMMAMVIHQFRSAGHYRAVVMERGRGVADLDFEVDEKSQVMQLDIDLAQAVREAKSRPEDCCCESKPRTKCVISPEGYVLFHASSGSGYSVIVANGGDKPVFDSAKLGDGDLFAVTLLEPATYSMTNKLDSTEGEIVVSLTPEMAKRIKALETCYIDVGGKGFDPGKVELTSSQGLVFRVKGKARIVVDKKYASRSECGGEPVLRWRKPRTRQK